MNYDPYILLVIDRAQLFDKKNTVKPPIAIFMTFWQHFFQEKQKTVNCLLAVLIVVGK